MFYGREKKKIYGTKHNKLFSAVVNACLRLYGGSSTQCEGTHP